MASSRSAGVTAAATYALLCCATALFFWGFVFLKLINSPQDEQGHNYYDLFPVMFLLVALVPPAVIAVGMRVAVGLLHLRPWARRVSMIWASVCLILCLALIAFKPFETFVVPQRFVSESVLTEQMVAISFVLMMLPVSVWWLFYFRTRRVKEQFLPSESTQATAVTSNPEKN